MMKHGFQLSNRWYKPNSHLRRGLLIMNLEAIPAIVILQLLSGPFLTGYLLFLGASTEQIGLVLSISTFVNMIQILIAWLMQKLTNRKLILIIAASLLRIFWLLAAWIPFLVPSEWDIAVYTIGFTISFIANAIASVLFTSLIGDIVPAQVRGRFFGIRNAILGAVGSITLFIGGQILDAFPGAFGFQIIFAIASVMLVFNITALWFFPNAPFLPSTATNFKHMIEQPLKDRMFLQAVLFLSTYLLLFHITFPFFNYIMLDLLQMSYAWVSIVTVIHTLAVMISNYVWGNWNARIGNRQLLYYVLPFMALACVLWLTLLVFPQKIVVLFVFIVLGIGLAGFNQLVFNFIIGDTPKSERPMYIAMYSTISGLFVFVGILFGGWLYEFVKIYPDWVQTIGIAVVIGCVLFLYGFTVGRRVLLRKS